jgi:hypothetical protein
MISGSSAPYGPAVARALVRCWKVLRAPAGERMASMLPVLVPLLGCDKELDISDAGAARCVAHSGSNGHHLLIRIKFSRLKSTEYNWRQ